MGLGGDRPWSLACLMWWSFSFLEGSSLWFFFFFKIGYPGYPSVAQTGLKLTMYPRLASTFVDSSCLSLLSARTMSQAIATTLD